jgi:hypothetical protein
MRTADKVFSVWEDEIKQLRMFDKFEPSTDFAFSIALDRCDMNDCVSKHTIPSFIHVKKNITEEYDWDKITWSLIKNKYMIVNGTRLSLPLHYYNKNFCTEKLIERYRYAV